MKYPFFFIADVSLHNSLPVDLFPIYHLPFIQDLLSNLPGRS